ncbi:MAG: hypothetical protein OXM01_00355, partial [Gemmatimonadota bacterium]|nr:hypothetical protein [Gemmatimonadota bacterium]
MIHDTKLFVRRLAYMPWLLAVGLVLGWTGEAAAQDPPTLLISDGTGAEGATVTFTLVVSPPLTGETVDGTFTGTVATVDYVAIVEGDDTASLATDFTSTPMTLTITGTEAGVSTATITIAALDETPALDEPDETFTLVLSNPSNVAFSGGVTELKAMGTITDGDDPVVANVAATADPAVAAEGASAQFTVTLGPADAPTPSGQVVMVNYEASVTAGTGASADDFEATKGTVTIPVGETSAIVSVPITDDAIDEVDTEGITLTLTLPDEGANATLGTPTATVTITDGDDTPDFSVMAGDPVDEGTFATFTVSLSGESSVATTITYTVVGMQTDDDLTAEEGTDFTATTTPATLNFAAGTTSMTVSVP